MKALSFREPKLIELIDVDAPSDPGPGEARVRVHRVGICGTDISGYLGKMPLFRYPRIPGHELGVEVIAIGEGVENVQPGDRCSVEPYMNCGECFACRRGATNCCERLEVLGVHIDGGLRREFVLPARKLHPSAKLSDEQLALVETLAIGCHAVDRAAPQPGENVLIIGAGPIGLSVLEFARIAEANVTMLDLDAGRLEFCRESMGVTQTIQGPDDVEAKLRDLCGGDLPTVVVDATGSAKSMSQALEYVGTTGRLVYVGITTDPLQFHHMLMHKPELTLLASRNALPSDFRRIIGLIEEGRINTQPWITHRTAFDDLVKVFPSFTLPETGVVKAMVDLD